MSVKTQSGCSAYWEAVGSVPGRGWVLDVNLEVHSVAPNADVVWLLRGIQYQADSWFSVWVSSGKQLCRWAAHALWVMPLVWCLCVSNLLTTVIETQTLMVCLVLPFLQPWLESALRHSSAERHHRSTTCATYTCVTPKTKRKSTIGSGKRRNVVFHVSWTVFEIEKKKRQLEIAPLVQIPHGAFRVNLSQEL